MADNSVKIGSYWYELARENLLPTGARRWQIGGEPAQPSPGVTLQHMDWELSGPHFNSFERIAPGETQGYLGTDYTIDLDTRWDGKLIHGPKVTTVDLSGTAGTGANTNCWTRTYDMNATEFILVGRGTKWAKINPATWAVVSEGSAALPENITCMQFTRTPGGAQEISVGMRTTAYYVISAVANAGGNDTRAVNGSGVINSVMILGPDRVFGAQDVAAATAATLRGNILTGAVTMAAPAWATNATLPGHNAKINSLGLDGNFVVVGTTRGPQMLDPQYNVFRDLALEIDNDAFNCAAMGPWSPYGLTYSLPYGSRTQYAGQSVSDGPENFPNNQSPVGLRLTAVTGADRWEYRAYYDATTDDTYLVAGRPRQAGDPHSNPMSFYCLRKLTDVSVNFLGYPATFDSLLSTPVVIGGYDMNMFYMKVGAQASHSTTLGDFATDGYWYGTESRRDPDVMKDICAIEYETESDSDQITTFGVDVTPHSGGSTSNFTDLAGTLTDPTTTGIINGPTAEGRFYRLFPVSDSNVPLTTFSGRRLKPRLRLQNNSITAAGPRVIGKLRLLYRPRPILSKTLQFSIVLDKGTGPGLSVSEAQAALITAWGAGPVACENPDDGLTASYIRVDRVDVTEVQDKSPDRDRSAGAVRIATVHAFVWPTAAGQ